MNDLTGVIFNIQRYSLHDGDGIRTVVFLKGCPLSCKWCANPESISRKIDIMFQKNKCIKCMACIDKCPESAISYNEELGQIVIDRKKCSRCGICATICPTNAFSKIGEYTKVSEVVKRVSRDFPFFKSSGGGVTLSGGEILFQASFAYEVLTECRNLGINTAIETSGNGRWEWLSRIAGVVDTLYFDLKAYDDDLHRKLTSSTNRILLKNLRLLDEQLSNTPEEQRAKLIVRIPMIEGYNMTEKNIKETTQFLKNEMKAVYKVELLPFHNFGEDKYVQLDKEYQFKAVPNMKKEVYEVYLEKFRDSGISAEIMTW